VDLPVGAVGASETYRGCRAVLASARERVFRLRDRAPDAFGGDTGPGVGGLREGNDELFAAPPRDEIALAGDARQDGGPTLQHRVAGVVAERVVHLFEVIDVEEEHAHRKERAGAPGPLDPLDERTSIEEAGERVGRSETPRFRDERGHPQRATELAREE